MKLIGELYPVLLGLLGLFFLVVSGAPENGGGYAIASAILLTSVMFADRLGPPEK